MKIQIKIINDSSEHRFHIFENFSIDIIKLMIKHKPQMLIEKHIVYLVLVYVKTLQKNGFIYQMR